MAEKKTYAEGCLAAHALDLIGDRWALLVVRELMLGPRRFGLIRAGLPGIATNMLARRLEDLEAAGILTHRTLPPPARVPVYELTDHGRALRPLLLELCRWGVGVPGHDPRLPISPTSLMLSMEAMMRPGPGSFTAGFDLGAESFVVNVEGPRFEARPGEAVQAEMRFSAPPNDMAVAIYGPALLAQAIASGRVSFTGDPGRGQAFVDLFRLARP
ncbi:winged helix-turn-helix transcriptional regulator [Paracoccus chinensis]|uniref:Transcriptional regulator, HxlR family n=1 Tax=Paracoccus chinensis TaxID=525640 RepID=A0A1G9FRG7_9RHOB|nr:winged helix-turn-helix transcriptional regulator [Paracoccus chinensis]SDK91016.1 transcriptional regulator, HxlR family [Paracoccus chinensis]